MNDMKKSQRGFILPTVYMVVAVLFILSGALHLRSVQEKRLTDRYLNSVNAFYLAESGIDQALVNLRANSNAGSIAYTASAVVQGGYQVTIENIGSTMRRLTAVGYVPSNNTASVGYSERRLEAYVSNSKFKYGLFGIEEIELMGNAVVDSYDSSAGAYDPNNFGSNGDIGTNSGEDEAIELSGNVLVHGDAAVDAGSNPNEVIEISGNAAITGSSGNLSSPLQADAPVVPPGTPNGGQLKLQSNEVVTLPGGTYWYTKIELEGNSRLIFTGDTELYVSDEVKLSGNSMITTQTEGGNNLPTNLTMNMTTSKDAKMSGNSVLYGAIYAPLSEVEASGNALIYGAITGGEIEMSGNAKVHYDEALLNDGGGASNDWRVVSWREVYNP